MGRESRKGRLAKAAGAGAGAGGAGGGGGDHVCDGSYL